MVPGSREPFENAAELAALLDREAFVRCVGSKLLAYALGRPLGAFDVAALDAIVAQVGPEAQFRDLAVAIAQSAPFRSPPDEPAEEESP